MTSTNRVFAMLGALAVAVALVLPSQSIAQGPPFLDSLVNDCEKECYRDFRDAAEACRGKDIKGNPRQCIADAEDDLETCLALDVVVNNTCND